MVHRLMHPAWCTQTDAPTMTHPAGVTHPSLHTQGLTHPACTRLSGFTFGSTATLCSLKWNGTSFSLFRTAPPPSQTTEQILLRHVLAFSLRTRPLKCAASEEKPEADLFVMATSPTPRPHSTLKDVNTFFHCYVSKRLFSTRSVL